jgi:hypothetical protein
MATGDSIVSGAQLGVGATENLSTLTVRSRVSFNLTGTVAKTGDQVTLTGTGTAFLSELNIGDRVCVPSTNYNDEIRAVVAIASDTLLTVGRAWLGECTAETAVAMPSAIRVDGGPEPATPRFIVDDDGQVGVGTAAPNGLMEIVGPGSGDFAYCPNMLAIHTPEGSDAWAIAMTTESGTARPGVALYVTQWSEDGGATLTFTVADGIGGIKQDIVKIDGNGLHLSTGFTTQSTIFVGNGQIGSGVHYVYAEAGAGGIIITLPDGDQAGRELYITKMEGAGTVTIVPGTGQTINGAATNLTITNLYECIKLVNPNSYRTTWVANRIPAA